MRFILVLVTTSSRDEAEKIAHSLLKEKLIACANIFGPVSSLFWWESKIDAAEEYLIFMKSEERLFEEITKRVRQLHSYEVPEIIALPIINGSSSYLEWLKSSLKPGE